MIFHRLRHFLCLSLHSQDYPQDNQPSELEFRDRELSEAPVIPEEMVSDLLCQSDTHKLWVLTEATPE